MAVFHKGWVRASESELPGDFDSSLTVFKNGQEPVELFRRVSGTSDVLVPRTMARGLGLSLEELPAPVAPSAKDCAPINLRDYQIEPVEDTMRHLRANCGGLLIAEGGRGKTVMALEIWRRLGVKALVLVHKEFLMNQWHRRIELGEPNKDIPAFLPSATVGFWQGPHMDVPADVDIVVGMVQTIVSADRRWPEEQLNGFGLVICDEVHRYGADTWQEAITMFPARYRLGLTATLNRKDGLHEVPITHIGDVAAKVEARSLSVKIVSRKMETRLSLYDYANPWNREWNFSRMHTSLAKDVKRTGVVVNDAIKAVKAGRKILILCHRVKHIEEIIRRIRQGSPDTEVGHFASGMKENAREEVEEAQVIVATYSMAAEALDIPALDTLLLASPQSTISQACWRIARDHEGKKAPLLIDYVDVEVPPAKALWHSREKRYKNLGYL